MSGFSRVDADVEERFSGLEEVYCVLSPRERTAKYVCVVNKLCRCLLV